MTDNSDDKHQSAPNRRLRFDAFAEAETFMHRGRRFSCRIDGATVNSAAGVDAATDQDSLNQDADRRANAERRSSGDRRCGIDSRSEVEWFLQGERRSGLDRRSGTDRRYRSFKKARAFVRGLKLKSESEWLDYTKSGMRPDDIPIEPNNVYENDGWAGWSDWLGATAFASYLSQYRSAARAFALHFILKSKSKLVAARKLAEKLEIIRANPQETCVVADREVEALVKPKAPAQITSGDNVARKRSKPQRKNTKAKSKPR